jgi:hypothetical protein
MPDSTSNLTATETTSWTDPILASGGKVLENIEEGLGTVVGGIGGILHNRPYLGATLTGGLGLGAAIAVGVGELTFTLVAAYIGYRVFAYGESLTEAVEKSIEVRQGKHPTEGHTSS